LARFASTDPHPSPIEGRSDCRILQKSDRGHALSFETLALGDRIGSYVDRHIDIDLHIDLDHHIELYHVLAPSLCLDLPPRAGSSNRQTIPLQAPESDTSAPFPEPSSRCDDETESPEGCQVPGTTHPEQYCVHGSEGCGSDYPMVDKRNLGEGNGLQE
jgi:hypothetical protein